VIRHAGIDPRGASFNTNRIRHWDELALFAFIALERR
jgi:hypothetical protein